MARANRHFIPGQIWHLTHRCHKKEFLLKFGRDRQRWLQWLYEARKRFGLKVLNYCVTSNHAHLLVYDSAGGDCIAKSVQLIAGRMGQEYNRRKHRKGAFWEDRTARANIQQRNRGLDDLMPNRKDVHNPKAEHLLAAFEHVVKGAMPGPSGTTCGFVSKLTALQHEIITVLEVPPECFSYKYLADSG